MQILKFTIINIMNIFFYFRKLEFTLIKKKQKKNRLKMKMNAQIVIYLALFATICFVSSFANPASFEDRLQSNIHHK